MLRSSRARRAVSALSLLAVLLLVVACGPPPAPPDMHAHPFLVCTRAHESDTSDANGNGLHDAGYGQVSPDGKYHGAYQFLQSTWDSWAGSMGWDSLIGMPPEQASVNDQDQMAMSLYESAGSGPWGGRCG